jgi:hypothetical protein
VQERKTTELIPGLDTLDENSWADVNHWCESSGVKPADVFNWVAKKYHNKTTVPTIRTGIMLYDKLKLNEKKKSPLSERAVILNLKKEICNIHKKKNLTDNQLYRIGKKSLERTPGFLKFDKSERKRIGY